MAADHIRRRGLTIAALNFRVPIGRNRSGARITGEIDIIAIDGDTLCFIEVKTRTGPSMLDPLTAVDQRKRRQIARTAKVYQRLFGLEKMPYRFDAIGITVLPTRAPLIDHRKAFWSEAGERRKESGRFRQ